MLSKICCKMCIVWVWDDMNQSASLSRCILFHACHAKLQKTKDSRRDARGRQGVHPTSWQYALSHASHSKPRKPRISGGTPGHTSDPLTVPIAPRLPRKSTGNQGSPEGRQGTPGRTSDPLAVHIVARLSRKSTRPRIPGGTPGDARGPRAHTRPLGRAYCPTPATRAARGRQGDPRGRQGTLGDARGRQGAHPTPWPCILFHACHANAPE